ncbi:MAG: WG repeat-containing protein [Planctomycetota bacterium]
MDRRKTFLILATVGALLVSVPFLYRHFAGQSDPAPPSTAEYFPVQDPDTGLWGFIDSGGNPVTPIVFDWAGDYRHGLGLAEQDGAMGYIDATFRDTGKWAIFPRFELTDPGDQSAFGFFEGRALARDTSGRWGYIGPEGKWAIEPRFAESPRDYPGVPAGNFSDGLAWFQIVEMGERNKLDENDEFVLDAEGKPIKEAHPRRRVGFIDRNGEVVIDARYEMAHDFGEGLAAVRIKSHDAWAFINKDDRRVIPPSYDAVGRFSGGLCAVGVNLKVDNVGVERWGYIDPAGNEVIGKRFDEARDFSEGLAAVREGEKWGYINIEGEWVIPPTFDNYEDYAHPNDPRPFENGLARVSLDRQLIYIDRQGAQVWPKD